jgi:hypothetical protein
VLNIILSFLFLTSCIVALILLYWVSWRVEKAKRDAMHDGAQGGLIGWIASHDGSDGGSGDGD